MLLMKNGREDSSLTEKRSDVKVTEKAAFVNTLLRTI